MSCYKMNSFSIYEFDYINGGVAGTLCLRMRTKSKVFQCKNICVCTICLYRYMLYSKNFNWSLWSRDDYLDFYRLSWFLFGSSASASISVSVSVIVQILVSFKVFTSIRNTWSVLASSSTLLSAMYDVSIWNRNTINDTARTHQSIE